MGLSRTVSEINGDFSRKSQNFPHRMYFAPSLKGFFPLELELGTDAWDKKNLERRGYRTMKEVWQYL